MTDTATPGTDRIGTIRAELQQELDQVESALSTLRAERHAKNAQIKAAVANRDELRSALAKLTPRTKKGGA